MKDRISPVLFLVSAFGNSPIILQSMRAPQAGPRVHACTASAGRTAPVRTPACALPFSRRTAPNHGLPCLTPAAAATPQGEIRGTRRACPDLSGNYFPRRGPGLRPDCSGPSPSSPLSSPDSGGGPAGGDFFGAGGEHGEFGFGEEACEAAARAPAGADEG